MSRFYFSNINIAAKAISQLVNLRILIKIFQII
uniref:Uncharacterized protein n=1 Tax=Rhizophora mucronata TaxID=61149 RepID=A0A2P2P3Z4_RHIMU